jgi:transcriptional regulator with XRE-family HTH domain
MSQSPLNPEEPISPLKRLRIQAGLTQSELARQIPDKTGTKPISQRAVSAWEAFCKALGVTLDALPDDCGSLKRLS